MTAQEIIARSLTMHPSIFVDALKMGADRDSAYAASCHNLRTHQAVMASRAAYLRAVWVAEGEGTEAERAALICAKMGPAVVALNVACKLQCIPPHVRTEAATRLDVSAPTL
jgi:hypothetical protein